MKWALSALVSIAIAATSWTGAGWSGETRPAAAAKVTPSATAPALPDTSKDKPLPAAFSKARPESIDELKAIEARVAEVVGKVSAAAVNIRIGNATGSGVIVSADGVVLTAGHVSGQPGRSVSVTLADGKTVKGKTLGGNGSVDTGMIRITDKGAWPFAEVGRSADLKKGSWCIALGHPGGHRPDRAPVVRIGRVLEPNVVAGATIIRTDCTIVAGDSGGPLFDLNGRVVGIHSRIGDSITANIHVPIDLYRDSWERLARGERWGDRGDRRFDQAPKAEAEFLAAFRPAAAEASKSTVRVICDGKDAALGTVIGPDGWVLTKFSQLSGRTTVRIGDGQPLAAKVVGVHEGFDLAMLKIPAAGLTPVTFAKQGTAPIGHWLAAAGPKTSPVAVGIMSVATRAPSGRGAGRALADGPPPHAGYLGIFVESNGSAVQIKAMDSTGAAAKAGLKEGDLIVTVNGRAIPDQNAIIAIVERTKPGDVVTVALKRDGKGMELKVTLGQRPIPRQDMNRLGSELSKRRGGFPAFFQTDMVIKPQDCGGPVCSLDGQVLGVMLARAGRTESHAVPSEALVPVLVDLMSGKLSPQQVLAPGLEKRVAELKSVMKRDEDGLTATKKKTEDARRALKKDEEEQAAVERRLKEVAEALANAEQELKRVREQ